MTPIRLIGEENEQVGIIETAKAIAMAREVELDLVEVAPNSTPPVCRIMDYGKWKYQQSKKEQKARTNSKQSEMKEVRVRPKTDVHDMDIKNERARAFLDEGHKVQFTMLFRGREMAHRDIGMRIFREIEDHFADIAKLEVPARTMGRRMTMILAPTGKTGPPPKPKEAPPQPAETPAS